MGLGGPRKARKAPAAPFALGTQNGAIPLCISLCRNIVHENSLKYFFTPLISRGLLVTPHHGDTAQRVTKENAMNIREAHKVAVKRADLALVLINNLDLALAHDPASACGIASDLEATLCDLCTMAHGIADPERLEDLCGAVKFIGSLIADSDRPVITASSPLAILLDDAYTAILRVAYDVKQPNAVGAN